LNRNDVFEAVILTNRRVGEIHRLVTMLAKERGLVRAMAHGAYSKRGKLKGTTTPFTYGTCYLYTNPVKEQHKITDFDVAADFAAVKEDIRRFYVASLWAETVLKSYGGGDEYGQGTGEVFSLFIRALESLASVPDGQVGLASLQFLWRYLGLNGVRPSLTECSASGQPSPRERHVTSIVEATASSRRSTLTRRWRASSPERPATSTIPPVSPSRPPCGWILRRRPGGTREASCTAVLSRWWKGR
jgi:DNA repair protein RecO (recombination protein O)